VTATTEQRDAGGINRRMAVGAGWMLLLRLAMRSISIVSTLLLARLLAPEDFGVAAMAMTIVAAFEALSQFGFDMVLIRHHGTDRAHYDTAWTMSVIRGVIMALLLLLIGPLMASVYKEPRIEGIMPLLALVPLIQGFQNIGVVDFRKHLLFDQEFRFQMVSKVASFVVVIPLAFILQNYWALIMGIVATGVAGTVGSYVMHPYRPRWSLAALGELFSFSKWLMLNSLLSFINNSLDTFIVGRFAGPKSLGLYQISNEISSLPNTEFIMPIARALYPGFAKMADDRDALGRSFLDSIGVMVFITYPLTAGIALLADLLVPVMLGAQWLDTIPLIQLMCVFGVIRISMGNTFAVYLAMGTPRTQTVIAVLYLAILAPLMLVLTIQYGLMGTISASIIAFSIIVAANLLFISRLLSLGIGLILKRYVRPVAGCLVMALVVQTFRGILPDAAALPAQLGEMFASAAVGAQTYAATTYGLWALMGRQKDGPEPLLLQEAKSLVKRLLRRTT
jgi:lipopolysaccharide exporter